MDQVSIQEEECPLVRGPNDLKSTGPNHLPYWEVLI